MKSVLLCVSVLIGVFCLSKSHAQDAIPKTLEGTFVDPVSCDGTYFDEGAKKDCRSRKLYNTLTIHRVGDNLYKVYIKSITPTQLAPSATVNGLSLYFCGLDGFAKIDDTDLIIFKEDNEFAKNESAVAIEGLTIKKMKDVLSIAVDSEKFHVRDYCGIHASFDDLKFNMNSKAVPTIKSKDYCLFDSKKVACGP